MAMTHEEFLHGLKESQKAVLAIAAWLLNRGHTVAIPAQHYAPTRAEAPAYSDDGDLFMLHNGRWRRLEAKHITKVAFHCREDWPYPDMFIAAAHKVERASNAVAYILINQT